MELNNKNIYVILFIILLLGLTFRIYHINSPFNGFHAMKEVQFASMAHFFHDRGDYFLPETNFEGANTNVFLPSWFILASWTIFGESEWAARLPFLLMGVISILIIFLIGKELYNERTGLIAAFFMTISPMAAYFSRNAQAESAMVFFTLLTIYFFLKYKRNNKKTYFFLSGFALLLATLSKYTMLFVLISLFLYDRMVKTNPKVNYNQWFVYGIIPILPTLMYMQYVKKAVLTVAHHSSYDFVKLGMTTLSALTDWRSHLYRMIHLAGGVNPITLLLAIIFLIFLFQKKYQEEDKLLITWTVGFLLVYVAFLNIATPGNNYYLISFIPPICLMAARAFDQISFKFSTLIFSGLVLIMMAISVITLAVIFNVNYPYDEAGNTLVPLLSPNEFFMRVGDPSVCYYSNHSCYLSGVGYNLHTSNYRYLSMGRATFLRDIAWDKNTTKYINDNFILLYNITGKTNLLSGVNFRSQSQQEYELIYMRIGKS